MCSCLDTGYIIGCCKRILAEFMKQTQYARITLAVTQNDNDKIGQSRGNLHEPSCISIRQYRNCRTLPLPFHCQRCDKLFTHHSSISTHWTCSSRFLIFPGAKTSVDRDYLPAAKIAPRERVDLVVAQCSIAPKTPDFALSCCDLLLKL